MLLVFCPAANIRQCRRQHRENKYLFHTYGPSVYANDDIVAPVNRPPAPDLDSALTEPEKRVFRALLGLGFEGPAVIAAMAGRPPAVRRNREAMEYIMRASSTDPV